MQTVTSLNSVLCWLAQVQCQPPEQDQKVHRRRRAGHLLCHPSPHFYASAFLGSRTPLPWHTPLPPSPRKVPRAPNSKHRKGEARGRKAEPACPSDLEYTSALPPQSPGPLEHTELLSFLNMALRPSHGQRGRASRQPVPSPRLPWLGWSHQGTGGS